MSSNGNHHQRVGKTNKKKQRGGRVRRRDAIGVGGAVDAIRNYDYEQQMRRASLPSFDEIVNHWRINPDKKGERELQCDLDGGVWVRTAYCIDGHVRMYMKLFYSLFAA